MVDGLMKAHLDNDATRLSRRANTGQLIEIECAWQMTISQKREE
jgi:hypothetical protein